MKITVKMMELWLLLVTAAAWLGGCAGCGGYEKGARVTPAFVAAQGSRVYVHPPKDQKLSGWMETYIDMELEHLGFKPVESPAPGDLLAYYSYSYDWDEPSYIRDFMIVFKPYPGNDPALLASASCYHRCSCSFTQAGGQEVHHAFTALREELNALAGAAIPDSWR
ncbi:MAG TPA: hypothetical protein ENN66_11780 [Proteobacteria bacterium]|nr:hypothetical protein [Pseudomonadota bacterium]